MRGVIPFSININRMLWEAIHQLQEVEVLLAIGACSTVDNNSKEFRTIKGVFQTMKL